MSLTFRIPFTGSLDRSTPLPDKLRFERDEDTGIINVTQANGDPIVDLGVLDPVPFRMQYAKRTMPDDVLIATLSIEHPNGNSIRVWPVTRDFIRLGPLQTLTPSRPTARNLRLFTGQILRLFQRGEPEPEGGILEVVMIPMASEKLACICKPEQPFGPTPPPSVAEETEEETPEEPSAPPQ